MDEYIGIIKIFAGTFAPQNYMNCDGSLLPVNAYQALFSILGTTYGGNGTTNFALPDLRALAPIGITGTGPGQPPMNVDLGQKGGAIATTLVVNNLPPHTHAATLNVNSGDSTVSTPVATNSISVPGTSSGGHGGGFAPTLGFNTTAPNVTLNAGSVVTLPTGGGIPISIVSPFLGVRYIICVSGIYPSRP